ncbi:MAG: hypothetical protein RQ899_07890 [Pseudomonadales bacterium]|nr:hypothetical protein [Pseudomonadales bacterium]
MKKILFLKFLVSSFVLAVFSLSANAKTDLCGPSTMFGTDLPASFDPAIYPVAHGIVLSPGEGASYPQLQFQGTLGSVTSGPFAVVPGVANLHGHGWMHPPAQNGQLMTGFSFFMEWISVGGFPVLQGAGETATACSGGGWVIPGGFFPPPPTVDGWITPSPMVLEGTLVTIHWDSSNATACTFNGSSIATSGQVSFVATPATAGVYTAECSGPGGTGSDSVTLTVIECPSSITVSPPHNPSPSDSQWMTNFSFLTSSVITANANESVTWTITPQSPAGAIAQPGSGSGVSINFSLSFSVPSGGSLFASTALSTQIQAVLAQCSISRTNTITQDTRDIIRQEYVNHGITVPARAGFNAPIPTTNFPIAEINVTAYPLIIEQPGFLAQSVRDEWNQLIGQAMGTAQTDFGLILSSAWRNPERNEFFNGVLNSSHQYGGAVDLVISDISSVSSTTGISNSNLWCLLEQAGDNIATGVPEILSQQVLCGNPFITHVHVQQ